MHLQVAAVDAVVVGDDDLGQLDVLVLDRLQGAFQRRADQVEAAERARLEPLQLLLVFGPRIRLVRHQPNCPLT